ncbi:MAG: inositol monophosphatase family protein [Myxococcota bacterium]
MAPALRQAAAIARALEGRVRNRPKAGESTAVKQALTIADTAAQEALLVRLQENFPDVRLEAEEDTPSVAGFAGSGEHLVVVDPIDGTLQFYLQGTGPYACLVGLARGDRFEAGLVALPREGLFFDATRGGGARTSKAGGEPRKSRLGTDGNRALVSHAVPQALRDALTASGSDVVAGSGGAVAVAPMVRGARVGIRHQPGPLGISHRGRIAAFVAREAGCTLLGRDGQTFPEDLDTPAPWLISARNLSQARSVLEHLDELGID